MVYFSRKHPLFKITKFPWRISLFIFTLWISENCVITLQLWDVSRKLSEPSDMQHPACTHRVCWLAVRALAMARCPVTCPGCQLDWCLMWLQCRCWPATHQSWTKLPWILRLLPCSEITIINYVNRSQRTCTSSPLVHLSRGIYSYKSTKGQRHLTH